MLIGGLTQLTCAPYPNSPRVVWVKNGELVIPSFRMLAAADSSGCLESVQERRETIAVLHQEDMSSRPTTLI